MSKGLAIMEDDRIIRAPAQSFIVRVWKDDDSIPQLRGEVEYVGTGEKRFFLNYWSLLNLIETWRHELEPTG
jgi:hypothetical protein